MAGNRGGNTATTAASDNRQWQEQMGKARGIDGCCIPYEVSKNCVWAGGIERQQGGGPVILIGGGGGIGHLLFVFMHDIVPTSFVQQLHM